MNFFHLSGSILTKSNASAPSDVHQYEELLSPPFCPKLSLNHEHENSAFLKEQSALVDQVEDLACKARTTDAVRLMRFATNCKIHSIIIGVHSRLCNSSILTT